MEKETKIKKLKSFLRNMKKLESFSDVEATEYVQKLREKNRIIVDKRCIK